MKAFTNRPNFFHAKHRLVIRWLSLLALIGAGQPGGGSHDGQAAEPRDTGAGADRSAATGLQLNTRQRVEALEGSGDFKTVEAQVELDPRQTAIVICDMWDQHWCKGATRRVAEMAPRMNEMVRAARDRGVLIIHCPSSTMNFYTNTSPRLLAQAAPKVTPKVPLQNWCSLNLARESPLPIDDSDGGCDDWPRCPSGGPWTRQIATIDIKEGDAITDSAEAYYLMQQRGIENVIVMGVHLNMCVLGRPFSIRQMVNQGKRVFLARDLTDTMYNSRKRPFVSHCIGTELMIEHVEKYWCPTVASTDFIGGEPFRFQEDKRPHVLFMIGEDEYHSAETLPEFARSELSWRGFRTTFAVAESKDPNAFPGLEALPDADLLVVSVRRRTPTRGQMALIRQHLAAGKPVVGIRTASHAFGAEPNDPQHEGWDSFDVDVLGAHYEGHYNNKPGSDSHTLVRFISTASTHPLLTGWPTNDFPFTSHLYRSRNLAGSVLGLLEGQIAGRTETEPVAWINTNAQRRVFYTSLGSPDDFKQAAFRRLLINAILWGLGQPVPPAQMQLGHPAPVRSAPPAASSADPQRSAHSDRAESKKK